MSSCRATNAKVWVNMSPENQGRFLRALIEKVVVDEDKGTCRVELIDFGAASGTRDAALGPKPTSERAL